MISHFYHNLYLVITRTQARMSPVAESETLFPDSVTHHPKVVLVGGWLTHQSHRTSQNLSKTVSPRTLKADWGLRMSAGISVTTWEVLQLPRYSSVWLGCYIHSCKGTTHFRHNSDSGPPDIQLWPWLRNSDSTRATLITSTDRLLIVSLVALA
jgi:hypothetical protein